MRCHQLLPRFVSKMIASRLRRSCSKSEALRLSGRASRSMHRMYISANKDYQPPRQGQVQKSADSLKASKSVHTHPSKDREKARRIEQERKARRWEASSTSVSSSVDWADQYFDEKWVHKQGRLSDWKPAPAVPQQAARPGRRPRKDRQTERLLEHKPQDNLPPTDQLELTENEGRADTVPSTAAEEQDSSQGTERRRWRFYATCHPGLEQSVAAELSSPEIQAEHVSPGRAGVSFGGETLETGYRACLWLRCAIRVLVLLAEGPVDSRGPGGDTVYAWTRRAADWPALLGRGQRFSVEARVWDCRNITSTRLVTTRVRDAICDAVRDARQEKLWPPNARHPPDVPLYVALYRDHCSLYRDMAGISLHRRGYRSAMHRASLNEAAAAGLLTLAGWPSKCSVLADPMCGSGTFLIEAALMAQGRAPGLTRRWWPFVAWPDFDPNAWRACVADASEHEREPDIMLLGSDVHHGAIGLAQRDAHAAGVSHLISLRHGSCAAWSPQCPPNMVITNPPWGERLGGPGQMEQSQERTGPQAEGSGTDNGGAVAAWRDLGTFLKAQCPNADAYILTGSRELSHELHMRTSQKWAVGIGGMDCRLLKYKVLPPKVYGRGV